MEHSTRLATSAEDGTRTQTVYDHLVGTARLAGSFRSPLRSARARPNLLRGSTTSGSTATPSSCRLKGGPKVDPAPPPGRRRPGFATISTPPLPWPDTTAACPTAEPRR